MRRIILIVLVLGCVESAAQAQYLGNITTNRSIPPAPPEPPGTFSNPYGNTTNSPHLYDSQGGYHGNVNNNPYDPNSIANPYGRYGSRYSSESVNNPYSQWGSRYSPQSPNNPYGTGMGAYQPHDGDDEDQ